VRPNSFDYGSFIERLHVLVAIPTESSLKLLELVHSAILPNVPATADFAAES
jgi:hypothetical protein